MENQAPFINISLNPLGQLQMQTNINDLAKINLFLDQAKATLIARTMQPASQIAKADGATLSAIANGRTVPIR